MTYGELPVQPQATDYEVAEDIIDALWFELSKLHDQAGNAQESNKLSRQMRLYHRERHHITLRRSAYDRTRKYHDVLAQKLHGGSAIENGKLKRPFHYGKASKPTSQPT